MAKDPARRKRVVAASPEQPRTAPAGIEPGQRRLPTRRDTAGPAVPRSADAPTRRRPANRRPLPRSETEPAGDSMIEAARLRGPQTRAPACSTARGTPRTGHHPAGVPAGTGTLAERPAAALRGKRRRRRILFDESGWSPRLPSSRVLRRRESSPDNARTPDAARYRGSGRSSLRRRADDPRTGRPLPRSETEPAGDSMIEAARLRGPQTRVPACSTARGTPRTGHHPAGLPAGTGALAERPAAALRDKRRRRRILLDESGWSPRLPNSRVPRRRGIEPE